MTAPIRAGQAADPRSRIARFVAAMRERPDPAAAVPIVAVGWATVELDRAATELAAAFEVAGDDFRPAADDPVLGAFCRLTRLHLDQRMTLTVVLVEPSTEARLSGTLARHGEGPVAAWLRPDDAAPVVAGLRGAGLSVGVVTDGPLGPARLILDGPVTGPHRFVLVSPGTIAS